MHLRFAEPDLVHRPKPPFGGKSQTATGQDLQAILFAPHDRQARAEAIHGEGALPNDWREAANVVTRQSATEPLALWQACQK